MEGKLAEVTVGLGRHRGLPCFVGVVVGTFETPFDGSFDPICKVPMPCATADQPTITFHILLKFCKCN